jgi:hypothetical protein
MTHKEEKIRDLLRAENVVCAAIDRAIITPYNWSLILLAVLICSFSGNITATASNNLELRTDMSKDEIVAYNKAIEELHQAVRECRIKATDRVASRFAESLKVEKADLTTQEQIAIYKAETQQDIDTYTNQTNYAQTQSEIIIRQFDKALLNEIIKRNPGVSSKEQALNWARSHQAESNAIRKDALAQIKPFETVEYKAWVANVKSNAAEGQNQAVVKDERLKKSIN